MSVESTGGNNLQKKRQYSIIYFKWYNRRTGEAFKNKAERVWTCPWQCFRVSAVWGKLALVLVFTCPVLWINFLLGTGIKGPSKSEVCLLLADHSFSFFKSARFTLAHAHERRIQHNWWVFLQEVFFASTGWMSWALSIQLWFWPGKHLWPLFGQLQLHSSPTIPHAILNSYWIQHFTKFSMHLHPSRLRNRWKAEHKQLYNIQSPIFWCDQRTFISSLTVSSHNIISATFQ